VLPTIEGGTINFIPYIDKYQNFNVLIDAETAADYMLLTIETASNSGPEAKAMPSIPVLLLNK